MSEKFRLACEKMEGKYTEEYGNLEPDVGGEFLEEHEEVKQWCTFKKEGIVLDVFNAPGTFEITLRTEKGYNDILKLWDNDVKKMFNPDERTMCFYPYYGIRVPVGDYCVIGKGNLNIEPHSDYRMKMEKK